MSEIVSENPDIRMIDMELPGPPGPKTAHVYVVCSKGETLVIDSGMDWSANRRKLTEELNGSSAGFSTTSLFLSHAHSDHTGLAGIFTENGCPVYMGGKENSYYHWLTGGEAEKAAGQMIGEAGIPVSDLRAEEDSAGGMDPGAAGWFGLSADQKKKNSAARKKESGQKGLNLRQALVPPSGLQLDAPVMELEDGDVLRIGDLEFQTLLAPGHTPGHMMLYLPSEQILFSGDQVLDDSMTILDNPIFDPDPLQSYLDSLEKLENLPVRKVFPGHGGLGWNFRERAAEIAAIHGEELKYTMDAAGMQPGMTAWEMVQTVRKLRGKYPWEKLSAAQKVLAAMDLFTHFACLQRRGEIAAEKEGGVLRYYPS